MQPSKPNPTRTTREQSTRDAEPSFDDSFLFEDSGALPNIPARPGYAQYWARAKSGGTPDARNMLRMQRRGWLPRAASTVPKAYQGMTIQDESFGGVISTDDLILMERPQKLQDKVNAYNRQVVDEREQAVKRNVFRDHQKLGGAATGFTAPEVSHKKRVERGVMLDDGD